MVVLEEAEKEDSRPENVRQTVREHVVNRLVHRIMPFQRLPFPDNIPRVRSDVVSRFYARQNVTRFLTQRLNRGLTLGNPDFQRIMEERGAQNAPHGPSFPGALTTRVPSANPQSANAAPARGSARTTIRFPLSTLRSFSVPEGLDRHEDNTAVSDGSRVISRDIHSAYPRAFALTPLPPGGERLIEEMRQSVTQSTPSNTEFTDRRSSERGRPVTEGPRARRGITVNQGSKRDWQSTQNPLSQRGTSAGGGPLSQPGTSARGGPLSQPGSSARGGPLSQPGTSARGGPPSQPGTSARGGPDLQRSMSTEPSSFGMFPLSSLNQSLLYADTPNNQSVYAPERFNPDSLSFKEVCSVMRDFDLDDERIYARVRTVIISYSIIIDGIDYCERKDMMLAVFNFANEYYNFDPDIEMCVKLNDDGDRSTIGVVFQTIRTRQRIWKERDVLRRAPHLKVKWNTDISWIINNYGE